MESFFSDLIKSSVNGDASVHLTNRFQVAVHLFLPHFDVLCDLLLNRHMATWNLFVLYNK